MKKEKFKETNGFGETLHKKRLRYRLFLTLFLCLVDFTYSETVAILLKYEGKVEIFISSKNSWLFAKKGLHLSKNDKIKCHKNSTAEILFKEGQKILIQPNTEISIEEIEQLNTKVKLTMGKVRGIIEKVSGGETFEIKTPNASVAVRGTDFFVEVTEELLTRVEVYEGVVVAKENITGVEVQLKSGEFTEIRESKPPETPQEIKEKSIEKIEKERLEEIKTEVYKEMFDEISKEDVQAKAAEEIKLAEFQNGKVLIDVSGYRVRLEEYIVRPQDNQFKYVVLNTRHERFDFGKILFTFNNPLPTDLRDATKDMIYKEGSTAPKWQLKEVDSVVSNTKDQVNEIATGGEMIPDDWINPKSWSLYFKNYNFYVNKKLKWGFEDLNSNYRISDSEYLFPDKEGNVGFGNPWPESTMEYPLGEDAFHIKYKDVYADNSWIVAKDYIIDDEGKVQSIKDFERLTIDEKRYKIYGLNFERVYEAKEFEGRNIDLVWSSKLLIDAGLLKLP